MDSLASSRNRLRRFDGVLRNLAKMFLDYQCSKGREDFFYISNTFSLRSSHVTKIGKYSIRLVQNRFSQQPIRISKKPDMFVVCSLSSADSHYVVCLVVRANTKAGTEFNSADIVSFAFEGLLALTNKSNLKNNYFF